MTGFCLAYALADASAPAKGVLLSRDSWDLLRPGCPEVGKANDFFASFRCATVELRSEALGEPCAMDRLQRLPAAMWSR